MLKGLLLALLAGGFSPTALAEREVLFYRNPMNPAITSPTPAKDEMGMDYIPVYADEAAGEEGDGYPVVSIRPEVVNNLGVRVEPVASADLARRIDAVGYVELDERRLSHVHLRASGWVEDLRVRSVGEEVAAGQLLFRFYSPDLVNAQQEFIQSLAAGEGALARASEERLRALAIPDSTIREIRDSRRPQQLVPVFARHGGVVSELNVREGMYVEPEAEALTLADLSSVWVIVDVFERQASWVRPGQAAELRLPALPGKVLKGKVEYLYPTLDQRTRTLRARLRFDNPGGELRPNMYASATLLAEPRSGVLTVPRAAVIRTGEESRVVRFLGEGRFQPVVVETGIEAGDRVEVRSGLAAGQQVVVSAQFLLDSESNLKASLRRMTKAQTPALKSVSATAKVNSVDAAAGKVNVTHDPIPEIGWPAMTMDFTALPEADLSRVQPGQRVRIELKEVKELDFRLAGIEPVAAGAAPATSQQNPAPDGSAQRYTGRGVVNRVDPAGPTISITHEPMPELGWPKMTMDFKAVPEVKLQGFSKGDRVEFELRALDEVTYELIALRPAGEGRGGGGSPAVPGSHGGHH